MDPASAVGIQRVSRRTQILMAGVSAMAFFRSSLFVVRAGDRDVGVGPSGFLRRTMVYSPWSAFFARYAAHRFFIRPIPLVRLHPCLLQSLPPA